MPEPRDAHQCANKQRFGSISGGFGAQMRSENRSVRGFPRENLSALLISPLPMGAVAYSGEKSSVDFERSDEMLRHMRWHDAGRKSGSEHLVRFSDIRIAKAADDVAAVQAERSCAVQDQSTDGVRILSVALLNRDVS
jgi:hypothetical protein